MKNIRDTNSHHCSFRNINTIVIMYCDQQFIDNLFDTIYIPYLQEIWIYTESPTTLSYKLKYNVNDNVHLFVTPNVKYDKDIFKSVKILRFTNLVSKFIE
jgi:hypothetical protein